MFPPEWQEFENEFTAKFGAAHFAEIYGTQEEQTKFKKRISTAVKSKVEKEEMEKIWKKIDNFNPDDLNVQANVSGREEDAEEIESSDAQINERLQNLALSDEGASSSTTTITTTAAAASTAETSAAPSSSTTTTAIATTITTTTMSTKG
uniref:Uncharacterized protein n=1 Tax=Panagrolaimus sp. PS1159 TaxID=55785 RepID=A0AC35FAF1_9BILA